MKHRQFGDSEFACLWGTLKTGCSFSLIKPTLQFYPADFYQFDMVTYYFSDGCKISTGFLGPTHTEKEPIISSLTAATGIISHSVFQYLETCMLQTFKKKEKKKAFYSSKNMVVTSLWLQPCLQLLTHWSRKVFKFSVFRKFRKVFKFIVSAFWHCSPVLRLFACYDCRGISIWYWLHLSFSFFCKWPWSVFTTASDEAICLPYFLWSNLVKSTEEEQFRPTA